MTGPTTQPATSAMSTLVAGLDLLTGSERDTDHHARQIAAVLAEYGVHDATVATHWARVGQLRHVALTVAAVGDEEALWKVLTRAAAAAGAAGTGLLLANRYLGEPELRDTLTAAVAAHDSRDGGRALAFPDGRT